jgi:hypothetical protein
MFRSRRKLAAAAGFWVLLAAAVIGLTAISGAMGAAGKSYVKRLSSRNATPVGLSDESNHCTLTHSEFGDTFAMESDSDRCTWTNSHFSRMGRHEVFTVKIRFDERPNQSDDWESVINLRQDGDAFDNENCSSGGNAQVMLVRLWIDRRGSPDRWRLDIRGGESINVSDQVVKRLRLGPVVAGQTLSLKFDIIADYVHGAATVWRNGVRIYKNRDRPLGFHYDCNRETDLSDYALRMQHGVYRGSGGPVTLTSSGFRFLLSKRVR